SFAAVATTAGDSEPGFYVLAYRAPRASAEDLMDHACTAAR
ncbi:CDP-diacylglycerol diphosphatase, partial [Methylobacterium sp. WL103]